MTKSDAASPSSRAVRRCRACGYDLEHLSAARCPECGRVFDLDDPATFAVDDPGARRRGDVRFVLLGVVTAMLFITVPWAALLQLTSFGDPVAAAWAGTASFLFVFFWAGTLRTRPIVLALVTVLPASAMLVVRAGQDDRLLSLAAVVAGPLLAALVRGWLMDDGSNDER